MGYFPVRYDPRVEIYERKMFIRLATVVLWPNWVYSSVNLRKVIIVCEPSLAAPR